MTIRIDIRGAWESAILSQLPIAVLAKRVLKEDSQYLWANHYAANLLGYDHQDQLVGVMESQVPLLSSVAPTLHHYDQQVMADDDALFVNIGPFALAPISGLLMKKKPLKTTAGLTMGVVVMGFPMSDTRIHPANLGGETDRQHDSISQLGLTQRELACFYYFLQGHSAKQIANVLMITSKTVEAHLANLKKKVGVHTRSELYEFARNKQLLHVAPFINLTKKKPTRKG